MTESIHVPKRRRPLLSGMISRLTNQADVLAATYGLGDPVGALEPVARGEQGRVWRLDTDRGAYAVKEPFDPPTETDAAADVDFQEAVLAQSNVSIPRPVRTTSGAILAKVTGRQVRVYAWVDLLPVDVNIDPVMVGETVAAIHRVSHDRSRPLHAWYTEPVGAGRWTDLNRGLQAVGAPFAAAFAAEVPMLIKLESLIEAPLNLQNCHRDLFADNILPTPKGGPCVIDWENCGLEDPSHELVVVLFDFCYSSESRAAAMYDTYRFAGGPGRLNDRGVFSMLIAQSGHFFEAAAVEWLDPLATDENRSHSIGRFDELFTRPLTVDRIDQILDAVGP